VFIGFGTAVNVATVLVGGGVGLLAGHRLPERTRELVTQVLGLFTLVLGASSVASGLTQALSDAVGPNAPMLVVLGALLLGAVVGAGPRAADRLDGGAAWLQRKVSRGGDGGFAGAMVTATLVFCVGPMSILGSLSDGLGTGAEQLVIKAIMDGFAAIAFAASLGPGVLASALPLAAYQGLLTLLGHLLGNFLSTAQVDALGATGGVVLIALGIRLAGIKPVRAGDLLPALVFAPLLVWATVEVRGWWPW
jgi:uncharacterized membrane protein YqgA involved in biofilm formation